MVRPFSSLILLVVLFVPTAHAQTTAASALGLKREQTPGECKAVDGKRVSSHLRLLIAGRSHEPIPASTSRRLIVNIRWALPSEPVIACDD